MTEADINSMDMPRKYKKRESSMNKWLNIIYKMMDDNHSNETIYFYLLSQPRFCESKRKLAKYIYLIGTNNFPERTPFNETHLVERVLPEGIIVIKQREILKNLLTRNAKTKKDEKVEKYIKLIKEEYPIANLVESIFKEFHSIIMGKEEAQVEHFIEKYEGSKIKAYCNGLRKDLVSVKNAIISSVSSGFVEGNNNKFKLIKRIVYGRSGLENLAKKCKLVFLSKAGEFTLSNLI